MSSGDGISLQSAEVIVAGGKGIGGPEGFRILSRLASLLGGAVGATRSAVDAGWIPYAHQIGQTGVTVRPRLYLAFGVSGAVQHIAGMNAANMVVAVNTDRHAPIFRAADYGIIADWRETAEYFIKTISERKAVI
jgi:electron transfer flavoprotein alpha subunit